VNIVGSPDLSTEPRLTGGGKTISKKREDRKPVWATIALVLLGIIDLFIGIDLTYNPFESMAVHEEIFVFASFIIFCQVTDILAAGILLGAIYLPRAYSPKGWSIDTTHQWIYAKTGRKHRDATVKDVYEHQHGYGSWEKKVERERKFLQVVCIIAAIGLIIYGINYMVQSYRFPILIQVKALIKSNVLFWISWIGLSSTGCFSIFMIKYVFWDLILVSNSTSYAVDGCPKEHQYKNPSLFTLIWRGSFLLLVVLMQIYLSIILVFPGLSVTKFGSAFLTLLPNLYSAAGMLFVFGAFIIRPKYNTDYEYHQTRQQDFNTTKDAMEGAFQLLVSNETPLQGRYLTALFLLRERNNLTPQGKMQVVEVLKILTGEDFGEDYQSWITWLKARTP